MRLSGGGVVPLPHDDDARKVKGIFLSEKLLGGRKLAAVIVLLGRGHMMALFRINTLSSILKSAQAPFSRTVQIGAAHTEGY